MNRVLLLVAVAALATAVLWLTMGHRPADPAASGQPGEITADAVGAELRPAAVAPPTPAAIESPPADASAQGGEALAAAPMLLRPSAGAQAVSSLILAEPVLDANSGTVRGQRIFPALDDYSLTRLGLQPGDVILEADGHPIGADETSLALLGGIGARTRSTLVVERGGEAREVVVDLAEVSREDGTTPVVAPAP